MEKLETIRRKIQLIYDSTCLPIDRTIQWAINELAAEIIKEIDVVIRNEAAKS